MTKRIFAAVLLLCLFASVVYAQSAATVFGWPPADGSVTNAKLAGPVSVANGGTGKTTAAESLTALGGASLNGSSTVAFNASIYNAATGTAAAPAYSFGSDPDTGIYSPGADTIGFGEGGAESMRITSGGNVLIATSTDDGSNKLQVNGFTKLGEAATGVKMKVLTGTTAAAEGGQTSIEHGLNPTKIISFTCVVSPSGDNTDGLTERHFSTFTDEYQFSSFFSGIEFSVILHPTNSGSILNKPFTAVIWYKE